jgi:hypothetical protein
LLHYVTYDGPGTGYLVILKKPKKNANDPDEIEATFLVARDDIVAVEDYVFRLLKEQGHFDSTKLTEVPESTLHR